MSIATLGELDAADLRLHGNLTRFNSASANQAYNDAAHKHAVTHVGGTQKYWYDANGNVTKRIGEDGATYEFVYDFENRVTTLKNNGFLVTTFKYDGDGNRIVDTTMSVPTVYVGNTYEWTASGAKSYYYAGNVRVAMRDSAGVRYLLGDHLGSTALTTDSNGARQTELRYYPYGKTRYTYGTTPTTYRFTGQRQQANTNELYFYQSRWYDPLVGRFLSADTIVPDPKNPQDLNRYTYVRNSPLKYADPSGHCPEGQEGAFCRAYIEYLQKLFGIKINDENHLWTFEAMSAMNLGLLDLQNSMDQNAFNQVVVGTVFRVDADRLPDRMAHWSNGQITVGANMLESPDYIQRNTVHELAHHWDWLEDDGKSKGLVALTGSRDGVTFPLFEHDEVARAVYKPLPHSVTDYGMTSRVEDWAESLTVSVYPNDPARQSESLRDRYAASALGKQPVFKVTREYGFQ